MIRLTFLGTAAARPTVARGVSAIALQREGDLMLLDCGEGTQRQMMRYGTGFTVRDVYFTHLHADHLLGIVGLLRTMALQGREEGLRLVGPPRSARTLREAVHFGVERVPFPVDVQEVEPGDRLEHDGYAMESFAVSHGTSAVGWALVEDERPGRFDVDRARALGVPDGPLFGQLHRGTVIEVDGRSIDPSEVVGPARPGRRVVYTGDTRPCASVVEAAHLADLLVHEATFGADEGERARATGHCTSREAAEVARTARVEELILTHISARYSDDVGRLRDEARRVFPNTRVAYDGLCIEVPFKEESPEDRPGHAREAGPVNRGNSTTA